MAWFAQFAWAGLNLAAVCPTAALAFEHGGFEHATVNGTDAKDGLIDTIQPGGPQASHGFLLATGQVDFCRAAT